ncbi:MAG: integration host factor [Firmicutes bacterium]|nr:integration host factor [Bacillota bacterium]
MALPHLTQEEKMNALKKAQEMRSKRAQLRAQLKRGELSLQEVLDSADDEAVAKMRVAYLIESLPQVGKVTSKKIMDEIGINENRRVQGLGKRQRDELLKRLG